jgi:predicted amidohydrolase YtcJ
VYDGLKAAVKMANGFGVTAVREISGVDSWDAYKKYAQEPDPTLRFALYATTTDWTSQIAAIKKFAPVKGWVEPKGVKAYMDGSLGSRTAWMLEPYTKPLPDQKSLTGLARPGFSNGLYEKGIKEAVSANLQVIVHAIGDRANREILDLFVKCAPDLAERRFSVEHAQHLAPADVSRFGKLGVIASMQPYHKADDGRYCEEVIGTERSKTSYAYREILDSKGPLAFGSDWSVVSISPWLGIETAVTGRILTGATWMTHQNISIDEALKAYTVGGAYAMRMENEIGQVGAGYRADFSILNSSPFVAAPDWKNIRPHMLFVEGREVRFN